MNGTDYLELLKNHIDITRVPFSDRGSRLLVFRYPQLSGLYVKLAERLVQLESDIEAYLHRPPFIQGLYLTDQDGVELDFEIETSPSLLTFHTRIGDFYLAFQNERTLTFGYPADVKAGMRFRVFPQFWKSTPLGGKFMSVRNVTYSTTGILERNQITPVEGGYEVDLLVSTGQDCAINISIQPAHQHPHEMQPFSLALQASTKRWHAWFDRIPTVDKQYQRTYAYAWWVMANNLISPQGMVTLESMAPSKLSYVGLWLWDNALHALAYRHVDAELARNQIRLMLAHQLPNGMLPDAVFDEGVVASIDHPFTGEVTKPPILAWSALKMHEVDPDLNFLQEIYVPLVRLNAWWFSMNDDDSDGLAQYNHPYSSGLDDSPLWDEGMPVESPDLNTYLHIQMICLAQIADILNMETEAAMWRRRAASLVQRMIKDFWDPQAGLFWALKDEKPVRVVTPFNLLPLWTGSLPQEITTPLLSHLTNPAEFWTPYGLPTVARNDPLYDPETMWRGPVWANVNYFFIEALQKIGKKDTAAELRRRTLDVVSTQGDIYEYYNPETGQPPPRAANIFGWTSAVFIDLAIQAHQESVKEKRLE